MSLPLHSPRPSSPGSFDRFLEDDFLRIGEPLLARAMAIDGHRLVLSGATGYFGKNLLALLAMLARRGARFEVNGLSRDPEAFFTSAPWARALPWLKLHRGEVREHWPAPFQQPDSQTLMLHAATDRNAAVRSDLAAVFHNSLAATRRALEAAAASGVRRLLLTGSGAQYGSFMPTPAGAGVSESSAPACDPLAPGSAYAEAKRVAELLGTLHAQAHGTAVVATRCFAFVGPGMPLDGHFVIGNLIGDALAGRPLTLASDGSAVRGWLYGADLALWLLLLLLEATPGAPPRAVNVGSDDVRSVLELAQLVREQLAPHSSLHTGAPRPGEPRSFYLPDISTALSLGLAVWTPLALAVQRTAAWHRA